MSCCECRDWCVIDSGDVDLNGGDGVAAIAVSDNEIESVGAVVVGVRRVGVSGSGFVVRELTP